MTTGIMPPRPCAGFFSFRSQISPRQTTPTPEKKMDESGVWSSMLILPTRKKLQRLLFAQL